MPLVPGDRFAGYTIERLLGVGAMGEVYLAHHPRLRRREALKVLPTALTGNREFRQRFEREADIAASLWHPHIVGIHDRGEFNGQLWISMDYVDGSDAARRVRKYPQGLAASEVLEIVTAVAEALDYAHQRQLLHRDVKPANILLARPEAGKQRVLLADFGIARRVDDVGLLTAANVTMGTLAYGAPEQLTGSSSIDGKADQYGLATSAFHLLTGIPPFHPSDPALAITQHLASSPPKLARHSPELAHLDPILSRALAKQPASRFDCCVDFGRALGRQISASAAKSEVRRSTREKPEKKPAPPKRPTGQAVNTGSASSAVAKVATIIPALVMIAAATVVAQTFSREHEPSIAASPSSTAPSRASSPVAKPPPVKAAPPAKAVVGARCAALGASGMTTDGATAYCARLQYTDRRLWSLHPGDIPNPELSVQPAAPPPADDQAPVRICMRQTGQNWAGCANDIHRANGSTP
ncbi:serine/threonine-protein kinase [Mycobacterium sp.]|uniref:serine/threonine-protein kinase n=1 Tax=Mycobacterium sp. TaxID=1785 RepID=UPI003D6B2A29